MPSTFSCNAKATDWFETDKGVFNFPNSSVCLITTSDPSAPSTFKRKAFDKTSTSALASKAPFSKFFRGLSLSDSTESPASSTESPTSKVRSVEKFEKMPEAPPSVADNP